MTGSWPAFSTPSDDGVRLLVRLTPKSSRDAIEGAKPDSDGKVHLAARVRAVPENGKANKALEMLVAKTLGVPKSAVSVIAGHTSRLKTLQIDCEIDEQDTIVSRLVALA